MILHLNKSWNIIFLKKYLHAVKTIPPPPFLVFPQKKRYKNVNMKTNNYWSKICIILQAL